MLLVHDLELCYWVIAGVMSINVLWQHFENLFQKSWSSIVDFAQRSTDGVARFCGRHNSRVRLNFLIVFDLTAVGCSLTTLKGQGLSYQDASARANQVKAKVDDLLAYQLQILLLPFSVGLAPTAS